MREEEKRLLLGLSSHNVCHLLDCSLVVILVFLILLPSLSLFSRLLKIIPETTQNEPVGGCGSDECYEESPENPSFCLIVDGPRLVANSRGIGKARGNGKRALDGKMRRSMPKGRV